MDREFDKFCQEVVIPSDPNAYIRFDRTDMPENEPSKVYLREYQPGTSIAAVLAKWYTYHPLDRNHRVFAAVYTERKIPGEATREVQLIPMKYAWIIWYSRSNWKLSNEEQYFENQNLDEQ